MRKEEKKDEKKQRPTFETHNFFIKAIDVNTEETVNIQVTSNTGAKIYGQGFSRTF